MSERLETTAQRSVTVFTSHAEALHARLNSAVSETSARLRATPTS